MLYSLLIPLSHSSLPLLAFDYISSFDTLSNTSRVLQMFTVQRPDFIFRAQGQCRYRQSMSQLLLE